MPKSTQHHLVWTRRVWAYSILRHNPYAKVKLSEKAHVELHEQNSPFIGLSKPTARRFEQLARKEIIACPRDVLLAMINVCERLLNETQLPGDDIPALKQNISSAQAQIIWLDNRVPRWEKRKH